MAAASHTIVGETTIPADDGVTGRQRGVCCS
jgi:hypothetical protein